MGRGKGLKLIFHPIIYQVTIYPAALPHNISKGHYLPRKVYCLILACSKSNIQTRPLNFCHDIASIAENSYASLQIFHNYILCSLFLNHPGSLLTLDRVSRVKDIKNEEVYTFCCHNYQQKSNHNPKGMGVRQKSTF